MMLIAVASVWCQGGAGSPILGAGAAPGFLRACASVEQRLHERDFDGAAKLVAMLPKSNITISWNDSAVPSPRRAALANARDRALGTWRKAVPSLEFKIIPHGDMSFEFVAGKTVSTHVRSWSPGFNPLDAEIALTRGQPPEPISEEDVFNEVAYGVSAYFGLMPGRYVGTFAARSDYPSNREATLMQDEMRVARANIAASGVLRQACSAKTALEPASPKLEISRIQDAPQRVTQGTRVPIVFRIANKGNAPLQMRMEPECGCINAVYQPELAAGVETTVKVVIDTAQLAGKIQKRVDLYSNDPDATGIQVPLNVEVTPRYRFLSQGGYNLSIDEQHNNAELFLTFPDTSTHVTSARLVGGKGRVSFQPWAGVLADPEMGEGPAQRHGYQIKVDFDPQMPSGVYYVNVEASTNAPDLPVVLRTLSVQKGIVALPTQLYFGEISAAPRSASFLLMSRGKPFAIRRLECDTKHIALTYKPAPGGYKITASYDGGGADINGRIVIETDDARQSHIVIPVIAYLAKG